MNSEQNLGGALLTCTNPACDCKLQIVTPCPHGCTYMCACGHPFEVRAR